jgi:sec-independent protein translocase protein TatC
VQTVLGNEKRMTVVEHLGELRRVLVISGAAWLGATVLAFTFNGIIIGFLDRAIVAVLQNGQHLVHAPIVTTPTETLSIPLKVASIVGIIVALPVVLWQVWGFIAPGLRRAERRFAGPFLVSALLLFAVGATFAYLVMPLGLHFLATFLGGHAEFLPDLNSYLSFFALLIVVFGLTFELPIAIVLLGLLGIVSSARLRERRKGIWVGIILVALIVTPGADPFTPTALLVPLIALFEASIVVLNRAFHR